MINIAIAEDHTTMRAGLVQLLDSNPHFNVLVSVSNGLELMHSISFQNLPDVFLIDFRMPEMDGISTIRSIRADYGESPKIIGFSMHQEVRIIQEILSSGANGYVNKADSPESLFKAITQVHTSQYYVNSSVLKMLNAQNKMEYKDRILNSKEESILLLICQEKTNQEIADKLDLSRNTINTYRTRMIEKLNVKNSIGLVMYAIREGIYRLG